MYKKQYSFSLCVCVHVYVCRRSEDTALFLLKEVYNCQDAPSSP